MSRPQRWIELAGRVYGLWLRLLRVAPREDRRDVQETFHDLLTATARQRGDRHALATALRCFGGALGTALTTEASPAPRTADVRRGGALESWLYDARTAWRGLRRRPGFALSVVALLALGIGATTTVWSVVDGVLLRDLPYPAVDRLTSVTEGSHSGPFLDAIEGRIDAFDAVAAAWSEERVDLTGSGTPRNLSAVYVSQDFFDVFGAEPSTGRLFEANDFAPGERPVVLSPALWRQHWGGDPTVLGSTLVLDGEAHRVVGILSPDFVPPEAMVGTGVDLWRPLPADHPWLAEWGFHVLQVVGRLRPGVTQEQAQHQMTALEDQLAAAHPQRRLKDGTPYRSPLTSLQHATVGDVRQHLVMLLGAVGLLLLVGLVNVANLSLARGADRQREMALRVALGAGRRRLARPLLLESSMLAVAGGGLGLTLAVAGLRLLDHFRPAGFPRFGEVAVDPRVAVFGLTLSLVTGLLFGLWPVLQASRAEVAPSLGDGRRGGTAGPRRQRLRGTLVVAEVALSVILLFGAGLLFNSLLARLQNDPGFEPDDLVKIELQLGERAYDETTRGVFVDHLLERLEAIPGIESTTASWMLPFDYFGGTRCCWRTPLATGPDVEGQGVRIHPVTPGYFETLGAPLIRGRGIDAGDAELDTPPIVLNRVSAELLLGTSDPIGQHVFMGRRQPRSFEVVGVVGQIRQYGYEAQDEPMAYIPYGRFGVDDPGLVVALRSEIDFGAELAETLRQTIWQLDPDLPISEIVALPTQMGRSLTEPRFYTLLLTTFALLSLVLAAAGLYGTLVYTVGQRRRELGIRLALGARRGDLQRLVVGEGLTLTTVGLLLGGLGALALGPLLEHLVYGVGFHDPSTLASTALLLLAVATLASWIPGRRAARTNPLETLRSE